MRKSKLWISARLSMWLRAMAPASVVTKVCGSTVWLVLGSPVAEGRGLPGSSLGRGMILVSMLKRTLAALAERSAAWVCDLPGPSR